MRVRDILSDCLDYPTCFKETGQFPHEATQAHRLFPRVQSSCRGAWLEDEFHPRVSLLHFSERASTWGLSGLLIGVLKGPTSEAACQCSNVTPPHPSDFRLSFLPVPQFLRMRIS